MFQRSSGLCRGIAQLLILLMVAQALPLVEIGHTYKRTLPAILEILLEGASSWWSPLTVHAAPPPAPQPNPNAIDALWVGATTSILKIDASQGTLLFEIPTSAQIRSIGVDDRRGVVWAHGDQNLLGYGFDGTQLYEIPLSEMNGSGSGNQTGPGEDLVVDSSSGHVWLGIGKNLQQFDSQGQLLGTFSHSENILALALDPVSSLLWVASAKTVEAVDETGQMVASLMLGSNPKVSDLDVDPPSGDLWIALKSSLLRYDPVADSAFEQTIKDIEAVAATVDSGVWAAAKKKLLRLDQLGETLFETQPFTQTIVAVVSDPTDLSVWAAQQKHLTHVGVDGEILHELEFHGQDPVLNLTGRIWDLALYADLIAPEISILSPTDGSLITTDTPEIRILYSDIGIGVDPNSLVLTANGQPLAASCNFDLEGATCTPSSPLSEGEIILTAEIQDFVGNVSNTAQVLFTVDTIAPDLSITAPEQDANLNTNQPTVQLSYSDNGSGVDTDTLTLQLNGSELPVTCSSDTSTSSCVPDLALEDGPATVTATIQDEAGNTSAPAQVGFLVDTVTPTLTIAAPEEGSLHNTATPQIQISYSDEGSGPDTSSLQLLANGNPLPVSCTSDASQATCAPVSSFSEGPVTLTATISDLAGNPSETAQVDFTVDTTAPELSLTAPQQDSILDTDSPSIGLTYSDEGSGLDFSSLIFTANGNPLNVNCTFNGAGTCTLASPFPEGTIQLVATIQDLAGNVSQPAQTTFTVDLTAPVITLSSPANGSSVVDRQQNLIGQLSEPADLTVNGQPVPVAESGVFDHGPVTLDPGLNNFDFQAVDAAGNAGSLAVHLTLNRPPVITSSPITETNPGSTYNYPVQATDPDPGTVLNFSVAGPSGMNIDAATGQLSWSPSALDVGDHAVSLRVEDEGGLFDTQGFTLTVVALTGAPTFVSAPETHARAGRPYAYDAEATDPDPGDQLTFSLDTAPSGMAIDPNTGLIQWTPGACEGGDYTVTARVEDAEGLFDTQTYTLTVEKACVPAPPNLMNWYQAEGDATDIRSGKDGTLRNGTSFASGRVGEAFSLDGTNDYVLLPASTRLNTDNDFTIDAWINKGTQPASGIIFGQSDGTSGSDRPLIWFRVFGGGSVSALLRGKGTPATVRADSSQLVNDEQWHHVAAVWNAASGLLLIYVDGVESGRANGSLGGNTASNDWVGIGGVNDNLSEGVQHFYEGLIDEVEIFHRALTTDEIEAIYCAGSAGKCVGSEAPSFTSTPLTEVTEREPYTYDSEATDPDTGDVLTFSIQVGPQGMTIDLSTGLVDWTPTSTQTGDHTVTLLVQDQEGLFDTQTFVIAVADIQDPPSITSTPLTSATDGQLYLYDVEATDEDPGDLLVYSLDVFPVGMEIDGTTGLIQWTVGLSQLGDHPVTVRVDDGTGLSDTQSFTVTVVNVNDPPLIVSGPLILATENQLYAYDVEATDPDPSEVLTYSLDLAPAGMGIDGLAGLIQWTPDESQRGDHPVTVRVQDVEGLFDTQSYTLTVGAPVVGTNLPPEFTSAPPSGAREGELYTYPAQAIDPNPDDIIRFFLDTGPAGMEIDPVTGEVEWTPTADQVGPADVTLRVEDLGGLFDLQNYSICVATTACAGSVFLTGHDADSHADSTGGNPFGARNINQAAINFIRNPVVNPFVGVAPAGFLFVESRIEPSPEHNRGVNGIKKSGFVEGVDFRHHDASTLDSQLDLLGTKYDSIVVASDGGGLLTQAEVDILVARSADIMAFLNSGGGIYATNDTISGLSKSPGYSFLPFVRSHFDNTFEAGFQLTNLGEGIGLSTSDVNGNVSHTVFDGTFGLHVIDRDADGQIISLAGRGPVNASGFCADPIDPPTIVSTPITTVTEEQLYTYDVEAVVDNNLCDVVTYLLEEGPRGMTMDPNTGLLQWTPTSFQAGAYLIMLRAEDINGIAATQSFTLTVEDVNHPPSITSTPSLGTVQAALYEYQPQIADADLAPAFGFDGDGDAVSFGDVLDDVFAGEDKQFTIDLWTNIADLGSTGALVSKFGGPAVGGSDALQAARQFRMLVRGGGSGILDVLIHLSNNATRLRTYRASTPLQVGVWHHIALVYDGTLDTNDGLDRVKIYIDGSADPITMTQSVGALREIKGSQAKLAAGAQVRRNLQASVFLNGRVDEVEVFNRLLSAAEVQQLYNAGRAGKCKASNLPGCVPPPSGMVGWWTGDGHARDSARTNNGSLLGDATANADGFTGESFLFSLDQAPSGMNIDPATGRIDWTPSPSDVGTNNVILRVQDSGGLFDTQEFTVRVDATVAVPGVVGLLQSDAEAVLVTAGLTVGTITEENSLTVPAGDVISQSPVMGTIVVEGSTVDLVVSLGPAIISVPDVVGLLQVDAETAIMAAGLVVGAISTRHSALTEGGILSQDPAGGSDVLEGSAVNLLVSLGPVPGDSTPPVVSIISPNEDAELISQTDVVGTVDDENLFQYVLSLSRISESGQRVLASESSPILDGVLGQIDTTLLENGMYRLRLFAEDLNGRTASIERVIRVHGHAKLGILRLSFVDLKIPVAGIPIIITRNYDSRVRTKRDFGIGWSLDIARGSYENNRTPGEGWQILAGSPPFGLPCEVVSETLSHLTEVRLSDREFYLFRTTLSVTGSSAGGCFANAGFEFVDGVRPDASLQVLGNSQVFYQNGFNRVLNAGDFTPYDPDQVRLTTADGRIFDLDRTDGTVRIEDRNGNSISITSSGVTHSTGKSIAFTRDGSGRITTITDPLSESITYDYDAAGDLVGVTDRNQNQTVFAYDNEHLLINIIDPLGNRVLLNEYDADGRLVAHVDAEDNRSQLDFDLLNRTTTVTDRLDQTSTLTYDSEGNVTSAASSTGFTFSFTYDARGNKTSQTDPLNHTRTFTYDAADRLLSETDDLDNTLSYAYRADGLLSTMTDEEGGQTSLDYDADGNLLTMKDANDELLNQFTYNGAGNPIQATTLGGTTDFTYDGFGNLTRQQGPESQDMSYTYDASGRRTSSTRKRTTAAGLIDETTGFTYDANGRLLTVSDPLGNVSTQSYDANGRLTSTTDPEGNTTTFAYSLRGKVARINFPDGTFERFGYDLENRLASRTDNANRVTVYEFNDLEQINRILHPDGSSVRYNFDDAGRLVEAIDGRGGTTSYAYDTADRLTNRADPLGNTWSFTPNSIGAATTQTDPLGNVTQFRYDSSLFRAPRRLSTSFEDGSSRARTYGTSGRIATRTDEEGSTTTFDYADDGNLIQVTDALGGEHTYSYDQVGNRISQRDANGNTTSFEYDANGNRVKTTLPSGVSASMSYDRAGNLLSRTDFNGDTTSYVYDSMNRRVLRTLPDSTTTSWAYTTTGQIETVTDPRGVTSYSHDAMDRIVGIDPPDGSSLVYSYDAAGNRTSVESPAGITLYSYDAANRLASVTDPDLGVSTYTYDSVGNLVQITNANGTETHHGYDSRNRLITVEHTAAGGAPELAGFSYELDARSNRTRMTESPSGRIVDYTYDALSRLTQEQTGVAITSYSYDAVGNRISRDAEVLTYDVDDKLLKAGTTSFSYDNNGNRLTKTIGADLTRYVYDARNQLVEQTAADGILTTFTYDAAGNRVSRATGSAETHFLVDPLDSSGLPQVVVERDELGAIRSSYVYGQDLLRSTLDGSNHYYHADGLGSTRALTDAGGSVTDSYEYDAFGNLTTLTGSSSNSHLFAGEQLDPTLGLYYLRARYMDPNQGRFTARDPFEGLIFDPGSLNKYAYAHNNPVNRTDPTGLFTLLEQSISTAIIAVVATIASPLADSAEPAQDTVDKIEKILEEYESLKTLKLNENAARAELGAEWTAVVQALLRGENQLESVVEIVQAVRDPENVKLGEGSVNFAYKVSAALAGDEVFKKVIMALWRGNTGLWMRILPEGEEVRLPAGYLDCRYNDYVRQTFGLRVIQDGVSHFKLDIGRFSELFEGLGVASAYTNFLVLVAETGDDLMFNTTPPPPAGGQCAF